ncbi:hypothetical protein LGZ99_03600 [Photorhabdus temperata]|uniref:Uncharacterized protein n=1 Tax=Photorhabdus temperata J3 TaxID=1389415 RepID=U7QV46_PHOTE|nr:hypothetical protein [Photorhabdus temperata]ERT10950.1 hypothetical protein O185_22035 [Photorhabdus temperata J3]MCT8346319.1 hypothetical protein [Photorhabdus temperata]
MKPPYDTPDTMPADCGGTKYQEADNKKPLSGFFLIEKTCFGISGKVAFSQY